MVSHSILLFIRMTPKESDDGNCPSYVSDEILALPRQIDQLSKGTTPTSSFFAVLSLNHSKMRCGDGHFRDMSSLG
jgi:hypothetical protein